MLAKKYRGLSSSQIADLFTLPHHTLSNRFFRVNWIKATQSFPQFAIIISPKIKISAVKRNRIRRILFEIIRLGFENWTTGIHVAILVKRGTELLPPEKLRQQFYSCFRKQIFVN